MQAFIYRHLVLVEDWLVAVTGKARRGPPVRVLGNVPIALLARGTTVVRVTAPAGPKVLEQLRLALHEPPPGVSIEEVRPDPRGLAIVLRVAGEEAVEVGAQGNLLIDVFIRRTVKPRGGKGKGRTREIPAGTLPAIPFEVTPVGGELFTPTRRDRP